ncbi:MAG TPA: s-methyl-5-thioribose-1-phosphate isomerase [Feifaniaceae bacterium]|nr:s-methyl-5-thioribose-1-phosphate isomerase [Feifaniaceae bacterium]
MQRSDTGLAFLLQYENIAWYENGSVRILDRRVYPRVEYVTCDTHGEVAQAITDMVTQSAGPFTAGAMGMALAAYECREKPEKERLAYLERAADVITNARPTTRDRMRRITSGCLEAAKEALLAGENVSAAIVTHAVLTNNRRYDKIGRTAGYLVDMIPNNGKVLTQCFGETIVGQMLKVARERGKDIKVFCAETRPYFQGARLTASVARDMGFDVTVITDNMPAFAMQREKIDVYTSAADVICMDGHVVNKVGTFQIAIAAKYLGVPYFVTGAPEKSHPDIGSVHIEMRDPAFTLQAMGVKTAMEGVKGYYPAFDITPPHLVSGVATDHGIYTPYDLNRYFEHADVGEFDIVV